MEEEQIQQKIGAPPELTQISEVVWELPITYKKGMLVPARIIANKELIDSMDEGVFKQISNVACLPGIQKFAYCMPDGHWGYGFPIGGVAAFDSETGVISPGGIGFDINCGMRLVTTNLTYKDVQPKLRELVDTMFKTVPSGVGSRGFVDASKSQFKEIMSDGSKWCVENGYGWKEDLERTEGYGRIDWAEPEKVSSKAIERGMKQLGTLGSGNHYLEIQVVKAENIFDEDLAKKFGIVEPEQVVVMVHCGSSGFGHQIGTDYLRIFEGVMKKYNIDVYDRELACAPFQSNEGQDYYKAMACAANMAFANRQVILHRKGSTRAFPPHHPELAKIFKETGQPVIIGGSMETGSFLLVGSQKVIDETFGSTAHGSGRTMSRAAAKHMVRGEQLQKDMEKNGIYVKATSMPGLAEEAGFAYKDINDVIDAISKAGISKPVVGLKPIGNIKGTS